MWWWPCDGLWRELLTGNNGLFVEGRFVDVAAAVAVALWCVAVAV